MLDAATIKEKLPTPLTTVQLLSSTALTEAPACTVRGSDLSDASFNTPYDDALLSQQKWPRRGFQACDFQIQNFEGLFFPVSCTPLLELQYL